MHREFSSVRRVCDNAQTGDYVVVRAFAGGSVSLNSEYSARVYANVGRSFGMCFCVLLYAEVCYCATLWTVSIKHQTGNHH